MDEKKLEEEYRELKRHAAPDLWARIEANLKDHSERNADAMKNQETEKTEKNVNEIQGQQEKSEPQVQLVPKPSAVRRTRHFYHVAAAAAAIVVLAAVRPVIQGGLLQRSSSSAETTAAAMEAADAAGAVSPTMAAAPETAAAPEAAGMQEGAAAAQEAAPEEEALLMAPGSAAPNDAGSADGAMSGRSSAPGGSGWIQESGAAEKAYSLPESRLPLADYNTEEYSYIAENGFRKVSEEPVSTFSADVDTAAYSNIRRMVYAGKTVPADAVRIEEMINYFDYDYPEPKAGEPFSVTTEYASCPWNPDNRLFMVGLQAEQIDFSGRPASNLVFLLDVSGSMRDEDKLPLVQKAFAMLAENLTEDDRVSIVTYSGQEEVVLDGVTGDRTAEITNALEELEAGGSTAGAAGIQKAYELARKHFINGGNNRVILATDGDLNVGISSEGELVRLIEEQKQSGVHLSVLGVGTGNLKDNKLEALADHGDGNYSYIDSVLEAKKVLVDEMGGTLVTVAKDVKLQLEFNPEQVAEYRLIGYENRVMAQEDFDDDKKDGGEIGAGHSVTALYEIVPATSGSRDNSSGLKYQQPGNTTGSSELLTVSLRYKEPDGDTSRLLEYPVEADTYRSKSSDNLTFAAAVAEFGMLLRDSEYKGNATWQSVLSLAESAVHGDSDDYRTEFLKIVEMAGRLQ